MNNNNNNLLLKYLNDRMDRMESKIDSLVEFKAKAMGIIVVISALLSAAWNCILSLIAK